MRIIYSCTLHKGWLMCLLLCLHTVIVNAQQFTVTNFRPLPNDITGYMNPVRDLNQEACALIKVVGSHDFVFSTPLGIVERNNEVGEIWVYVPNNTRMLTIKHPQWGVLRDYRFPSPLESRMTYELVLTRTTENIRYILPPLPRASHHLNAAMYLPEQLPVVPTSRPKRPKETLRYLLAANIGIHSGQPSFGLRIGAMRRHGIYFLYQTNFQTHPTTNGECNGEGVLVDTNISPYYTGRTKDAIQFFTAGGIHRIWRRLCLYEGIGYGKRTVGWETNQEVWVRNADYSAQGIAAEAGILYRFQRLVLSAGMVTIATTHWETNLGIGFHF